MRRVRAGELLLRYVVGLITGMAGVGGVAGVMAVSSGGLGVFNAGKGQGIAVDDLGRDGM